jgi:hypothetical protein
VRRDVLAKQGFRWFKRHDILATGKRAFKNLLPRQTSERSALSWLIGNLIANETDFLKTTRFAD